MENSSNAQFSIVDPFSWGGLLGPTISLESEGVRGVKRGRRGRKRGGRRGGRIKREKGLQLSIVALPSSPPPPKVTTRTRIRKMSCRLKNGKWEAQAQVDVFRRGGERDLQWLTNTAGRIFSHFPTCLNWWCLNDLTTRSLSMYYYKLQITTKSLPLS